MLTDDRLLRKHLAGAAISARTKQRNADTYSPRFHQVDEYRLGARLYQRVRVILRSNGCSIPTCTMCPLPNEALDPSVERITARQYRRQITETLALYPGCEMVSVYNDGNFFAERELPGEARRGIYEVVRRAGCRWLMVESLPRFITRERLNEARELLGSVRLTVGIGLQSASTMVREICVNTPVTAAAFLEAHALLREFECETKVYVMIKPPFLLEDEAVDDAVASAVWRLGATYATSRSAPRASRWERWPKTCLIAGFIGRRCYRLLLSVSSASTNMDTGLCVSVFNLQSSDFPAHCARRLPSVRRAYFAGFTGLQPRAGLSRSRRGVLRRMRPARPRAGSGDVCRVVAARARSEIPGPSVAPCSHAYRIRHFKVKSHEQDGVQR